MDIATIRHDSLQKFAQTGQSNDLPAGLPDRLRNMLAYLVAIEVDGELAIPPKFAAQPPSKRDAWSLVVSENWRLTVHSIKAGVVEVELQEFR